jgi:hypothetical protein
VERAASEPASEKPPHPGAPRRRPRVTESATSPSDAAAGFCPDVWRPRRESRSADRDAPRARSRDCARLIATRRVPARAPAFGAAPAPGAPRAQADAHPHQTLATRAAPRPSLPGRPQSATGAPSGARPHPSSPAQSSPLRRRVGIWRLTTLPQSLPPAAHTRAALANADSGAAGRCTRRGAQAGGDVAESSPGVWCKGGAC